MKQMNKALVFTWVFALLIQPMISSAQDVSLEQGLQHVRAQDYLSALRHFQLLAARGDAAAQYNLGLMYLHGLGVPTDQAHALRWMKAAARQGYTKAVQQLSVLAIK